MNQGLIIELRPNAPKQRQLSVNGADGHVLAEHREEALDLAPFAEANRITQLPIMAATRGGFIDREQAKPAEQVFGLIDAGSAGDVE